MKQYLPNKPHKLGFKLFCYVVSRAFDFDYAHKFEVYAGNEKHPSLPQEPDLGPTGNVVVRLLRNVPRRANHIVYFDQYYTSISLAAYLAKEGIQCLGKIQANRLKNSKFPDKKPL